SHGGEKTGARLHRNFSGIEQQESARSIGALRFVWREADLPKERRLLISRHSRNGNAVRQTARSSRLSINLGGTSDRRQYLTRNVKELAHLRIPVERSKIHQ